MRWGRGATQFGVMQCGTTLYAKLPRIKIVHIHIRIVLQLFDVKCTWYVKLIMYIESNILNSSVCYLEIESIIKIHNLYVLIH